MSTLKSKIQIIGLLTSDPLVETVDGQKKASVGIKFTETYKNWRGQKITMEQTAPLIMWGEIATMAEKFLSEGIEIAIEGILVMHSGLRSSEMCIQVNEFLMLGGKNNSPQLLSK